MRRHERRQWWTAQRIASLFGSGPKHPPPGPEIDIVFADDSRQDSPFRDGMGPLVAIGGIRLAAEDVQPLTKRIDEICEAASFPQGEPFKWSPGRELWMRKGLVDKERRDFYRKVLQAAREFEASATVVIEDTSCSRAIEGTTPETDVGTMFIERIDRQCAGEGSHAIVVVDRPGGDRASEKTLLEKYFDVIQKGTRYVKPSRFLLNVLSTPSQFSRLLQLADLVTAATVQMVAGDETYAPPVFEHIRPLFHSDGTRIGGYGLKIHPDARYRNLYHWIVGDTETWKGGIGYALPCPPAWYVAESHKK